jgi:hypothetical protein
MRQKKGMGAPRRPKTSAAVQVNDAAQIPWSVLMGYIRLPRAGRFMGHRGEGCFHRLLVSSVQSCCIPELFLILGLGLLTTKGSISSLQAGHVVAKTKQHIVSRIEGEQLFTDHFPREKIVLHMHHEVGVYPLLRVQHRHSRSPLWTLFLLHIRLAVRRSHQRIHIRL